jgi:hypothetical protein
MTNWKGFGMKQFTILAFGWKDRENPQSISLRIAKILAEI